MKKFLILAAFIFLSQFIYSQGLKVVKTFHIQSEGWWDYIAVHNNKLYVSHGTQVNILDQNTGDSLGVIPNTTGVHGIAFDDALNKGFTSNGRLNTVTVFDLSTGKVTGQISTGQNPDAIMHEPFTKTIITCNGASKDLSVIDPQTEKVVQTVDVGGKPETAASDNEGNLFVNIEDNNEIVKVNLKTFKVEAHWPLDGGEGPTGLAIDRDTKRIFAGCDKLLVVLNTENGKVVTKLPIGEGCDGVAFDPATKTIYTANGEGTITAIKETDGNNFSVEDNYTTKRGARTITIDPQTHTLFLPTADFDDTKKNANGRPMMIPGSFQVLVVQAH
jgi:YVTN family beta-propeller protein